MAGIGTPLGTCVPERVFGLALCMLSFMYLHWGLVVVSELGEIFPMSLFASFFHSPET